ncbi:MAG: N-acetylmuramic acid 6-phosphate etherase [Bryobacteraceae bacterium]
MPVPPITEQANVNSREIDTLTTGEVLTIMNTEDSKVAPAVSLEIPHIARAVDLMVEAIQRGGRVFLIGAGSSGRLAALDAAECPPTFNVSPEQIQAVIAGGERSLVHAQEAVEDDSAAGWRDLQQRSFGPKDVLVCVSAGGYSEYVLAAGRAARAIGAAVLGLTCNKDSPLAAVADCLIAPDTGSEVIAGSTRLKAGTATKLVLNMLSTATMVRLGYVYRNLMVNVHPTNRKLKERAKRIVSEVVEVDLERADELLSAGGSVRTAIVMGLLGVDRAEAERRLDESGGRISAVIGRSGARGEGMVA